MRPRLDTCHPGPDDDMKPLAFDLVDDDLLDLGEFAPEIRLIQRGHFRSVFAF